MATLNDFKVIKSYSKKYFKFLNIKHGDETTQARLGFYLFALECITGEADTDRLKKMINDTEFLKIVEKINNNDLGIDAVYVDDEQKNIVLFNFKYRENFNDNKSQSENDAITSSKFLNLLISDDSHDGDLTEITKGFVKQIRNYLNSDDIWELKLCLVSNENNPLNPESVALEAFKDSFGLEIESYILDDFTNFIAKKPDNTLATILLPRNSIFSYEEDDLSSSKSYLMKLPIKDLIRITGSDRKYRECLNEENLEQLKGLKLDFSVLFDNVRGYLGNTNFNKNILNTLENEPTKFFMFNNGITMTADDIEAVPENGNLKMKITLKNHQVVNGGQTLRTLFKFKDEFFDEENLSTASVLVRVFKTNLDSDLTNKIAEYTNSQNTISAKDLKSVDKIQVQIEQFLKSHNIQYSRKAGTTGDDDIEYTKKINMEKLGQLLYSQMGFPERASNQKKKIFEKYYNDIFEEENLDINCLVPLIELYDEIITEYSKKSYQTYEQKYFYSVFLYGYIKDVRESIEFVESALAEYKKGVDNEPSEARKLIQIGFKQYLARKLKVEKGIEVAKELI